MLDDHCDPRERALAAFRRAFGSEPSLLVRAPGRVNLIGEHTDYNDGFVLPCAIDFHTVVAARARPDALLRLVAADLDEARSDCHLTLPLEQDPAQPWVDYVRGVVKELLARGMPARGAELAIAGNVPRGAGLSSSAALEIATGLALSRLHGPDALTRTDLACIGQAAENHFVGCQCGIMDQLISAQAQDRHALLIDCRSLQCTPVALPEDLRVLIVDSGIRRGLVGSAYNKRRRQCEAVARHFGVAALRDVDLDTLACHAGELDPTALRRARHVVSENERVLAMREALTTVDLGAIGCLMAASHASMRDDFEITLPAIDGLVEILQGVIGDRGGARMTGGGFGGCVVALLPGDLVDAARAAVARDYRQPDGKPADLWVCSPSPGAEVLK